MEQNTGLSRVRRGATGVFVAATIATGGLTVALAVDGNHAGQATAQTEVAPANSARTAQPVDADSPAPAPGDTDGWTPTTPVTTTPAPPHEHTTGS
ncbi:hypothetical protein [Nocardia aurantia]|uniref:Uncharacterized protein n=1 Tax=Nocardia aurantia TaxID=2585199 RepID=A0A7K0DJG6_9NOCA|nr:hypothetical protein [Nocardia aurantia]MQY25956.1 hypothetical protein [Nocardia aurantia]